MISSLIKLAWFFNPKNTTQQRRKQPLAGTERLSLSICRRKQFHLFHVVIVRARVCGLAAAGINEHAFRSLRSRPLYAFGRRTTNSLLHAKRPAAESALRKLHAEWRVCMSEQECKCPRPLLYLSLGCARWFSLFAPTTSTCVGQVDLAFAPWFRYGLF